MSTSSFQLINETRCHGVVSLPPCIHHGLATVAFALVDDEATASPPTMSLPCGTQWNADIETAMSQNGRDV